jgi:hypothetical protein
MATFALYTDSGLTELLTGNLVAAQNYDGSTPPVDFTLWVGSNAADKQLRAQSNPGVDQITFSINDADPGNGHETTEVSLALTLSGLDSAVAGDPLNIGTTVLSGTSNAIPIYIRVDDATGVVGTSTELSIATNTLQEDPV